MLDKDILKLGPRDKRAITIAFVVLLIIAVFFIITNIIDSISASQASAVTHHAVGDAVLTGPLEVMITNVTTRMNTNGNKTISINVTIKNNGKRAESITSSAFYLVDSVDRTFESDTFSSDLTVLALNPGLTEEGSVSFEVPADASEFAVAVRMGTDDYVYFDLGTT